MGEIGPGKGGERDRRMDWVDLQHVLMSDRPVRPGVYPLVLKYVSAKRPPDEALREASYLHGNALRDQGKLDEAIALYQEVIRLKPDHAKTYPALVRALKSQGKLDDAVAAYREALRLKPDNAVTYFHLGGLLQGQDDFAGALALYKKGHELGSKQPDWKFPLAQWIAQAEREAPQAERLRPILKGEVPPKDNNERLHLARICAPMLLFPAPPRLPPQPS